MQEADIAIFGVISSHAKYLVCDLSTPIMMQRYYLVIPWPKEESRLLAPIRPFQPAVTIWISLQYIFLFAQLIWWWYYSLNQCIQVWLCIGICLVSLPLVLSLLSGLYRKFRAPSQRTRARSYSNQHYPIPLISFFSIFYDCSFVLSHLTNHGSIFRIKTKINLIYGMN